MNATEFSWEIACPSPWGEGSLVYFDFSDPKVYLSLPIRLSSSVAQQLCQFLRNFSLIERYYGLRTTITRITQLYTERGHSPEESGLQALLAVQLAVLGTESIKTPLLYQYAQHLKNQPEGEVFHGQISSLHGWALHECADYFLRDFLPQLPHAQEGPFVPAADLTNQAQTVRSHFRQINDFFSGEMNPYFHLSEFPILEPKQLQYQSLELKVTV